jgi:hypothetical protein
MARGSLRVASMTWDQEQKGGGEPSVRVPEAVHAGVREGRVTCFGCACARADLPCALAYLFETRS